MKKLFKAVFIITAFTMVDRVLGFGFKVFLVRSLGEVNFGIYQVALSTFFVLLTFTTSGLPLIVSKISAIAKKKGEKKAEAAAVTAALICGIVLSLVICGIVLIFNRPIGGLFAARESMYLLLLMLPAILFSGIYSSFRGNIWGRQRYVTVSVIELIEQVTRIGLVIILALMGFNLLRVTAISMSVALGVTAVLCIACYFKGKGRLADPRPAFKPLLKQAAPVTVIRASNTLVAGLVSIAVPFLLQRTGLSAAESLALFGASVGMAMPLIFLPVTVVGSLSYVLVPSLSASYASGDKKSVQSQIESAITFSLVVAALFVPAFFSLGEPLGLFVYDNATAGRFISLSAFLLIPLAAESIVSSMMNSLDLEKQSFINYLIGAAVMFGLMFATGRNFTIEILLLGMGLSWTIATILDIIAIKRRTGIKIKAFLIPLLKMVGLIFPAIFVTGRLYALLGALPMVLQIIIPGLAGFMFIASLALVFGVFDITLLFKGRVKDGKKGESAKKRKIKQKQSKALVNE